LPVIVGIFTAQTPQDDHFAGIGTQRKPSTPTGVGGVEMMSKRLGYAARLNATIGRCFGPNNNPHQAEGQPRSRSRLASAERHTVQSAVISLADVDMPARVHDTPDEASFDRALSEVALHFISAHARSALGRKTRHEAVHG
jgi:hypothetical protein